MSKNGQPLKASAAGVSVDLMRGLLAIMVLAAHSLESAELLQHHPGALDPWVSATLGHGAFWVGGFFVLSGFCVHRAIMGMRARMPAGEGGLLRSYLWARATRLYPIYLTAIAMAAALWSVGGCFDPAERAGAGWRLLQQLVMLQGVTGSFHELKPSWSLTYEVVYYLAWPALLIAFSWSVKRALVVGALSALMLGAAMLAVWKGVAHGAPDSILISPGLIAAQFLTWLGGAWLAEYWDTAQRHVRSWLVGAALGAILFVYLIQARLIYMEAPQWSLLLTGYAAVPCWLALILGSSAWHNIVRWHKAAAWLGLLSYPLYIMHQVILDAAIGAAWRFGITSLPFGAAALVLATIVMLVMALIGVPLEAALLRWRARFLARQRQAPALQPSLANG